MINQMQFPASMTTRYQAYYVHKRHLSSDSQQQCL